MSKVLPLRHDLNIKLTQTKHILIDGFSFTARVCCTLHLFEHLSPALLVKTLNLLAHITDQTTTYTSYLYIVVAFRVCKYFHVEAKIPSKPEESFCLLCNQLSLSFDPSESALFIVWEIDN